MSQVVVATGGLNIILVTLWKVFEYVVLLGCQLDITDDWETGAWDRARGREQG